MTRDTLNALITAILMVIGLIALDPGVLRGDRHSTLNPCRLFNTCATPPDFQEDVTPQRLPGRAPNAAVSPKLLSHQRGISRPQGASPPSIPLHEIVTLTPPEGP